MCACICVCLCAPEYESGQLGGGHSSDRASYANMLHMWLWYWRAGVVRMTPYPFPPHPIHPRWMWLSIHAAFTEEGGKEGGGEGGTVVTEGKRWSFSFPWLREKEKQLVCKWIPLLIPGWFPSLLLLLLLSIPRFCGPGRFRKGRTVERTAIGWSSVLNQNK